MTDWLEIVPHCFSPALVAVTAAAVLVTSAVAANFVPKMFEPNTHDANATATPPEPRRQGLALAGEEEGRGRAARWWFWFWFTPNGEPSSDAAGLLFFALFFAFIACLNRSLDR